jgi:hypothetical protein
MSLNPNAIAVARRLQGLGLTQAQIAGVLGNFQLESGFNTRVNEGGKVGAPMGVGGFGLAQWTGGRQQALVDFSKKKKLDPGSVEAQADFLAYELQGPEKRALESLKGAVSPEESARRFLVDFERAGIPKTEKRQKAARSIYEKLGQLDLTGQGQQANKPATGDQMSQQNMQLAGEKDPVLMMMAQQLAAPLIQSLSQVQQPSPFAKFMNLFGMIGQ